MKKRAILPALVACLELSGCSDMVEGLNKFQQSVFGAAPIDLSTKGYANVLSEYNTSTDPDKRKASRNQFITNMMLESVTKCQSFQSRLGLGQRAFDATFDIMTTILAGLGAVFVPANTARALAASAAMSSGTKTALDSDLYAQKTSWIIVDQIRQTYVKEFPDKLKELSKSDADWPLSGAAAEIILWHDECTLDGALLSMQAKPGDRQYTDLKAEFDKLQAQMTEFSKNFPASPKKGGAAP